MAISFPVPTLPPPDQYSVRVIAIDLFVDKRNVRARVHLQDDRYRYTSGASVFATWTLADGSQMPVNGLTNSMGYGYFELEKVHRGTITFSITNVEYKDFIFDADNSVLEASVDVGIRK